MDRVTATFEDVITSLDVMIVRLSQPGAQGDPDAKTERAYFAGQRRAYVKAQSHWLRGARPQDTSRAWLVPSATAAGVVYRVSRQGEVLVCDCPAAENERLCWHKVLVEVVELADDRQDQHDDGLDTADLCGASLPILADPDDDKAYVAMLAAL